MLEAKTAPPPAPWTLRGRGYLMLHRFSADFVRREGLVPRALRDSFLGGWGAVMLVDYAESNVGPYRELLFIPGRFAHRGVRRHVITKIYVSTPESVSGGRLNWSLPKELATFAVEPAPLGGEQWHVSLGERTILRITLRSGRLRFPMSTAFLPMPLLQGVETLPLLVDFSGRGLARLAVIDEIAVSEKLFPDVSQVRPLLSLSVERLLLRFDRARPLSGA